MPDFASALDNLQSRAGACGLRVSPLMVSRHAPDGEPWPQSEPLPRSVREQRSCARLDVHARNMVCHMPCASHIDASTDRVHGA